MTSTLKTKTTNKTIDDLLGTTTHPVALTKKTRSRKTNAKKTNVGETAPVMSQSVEQQSNLVTKVIDAAKNVMVGMGLAFLGNLPIFLDPVGFLFFNSHRIALGLIHLFMPLIIAGAAIWNNQEMMNRVTVFSPDSIILCISLYAFGAFLWMLTWLFARSVVMGIGNAISGFAKTGEQESHLHKTENAK